jgi:transposase
MGSRVETFEQIRRDRDREGLSIRALAERHGVHRRAVREALASPLPTPRKRPEGRPAPKLGAYRELIDEWLIADRTAPRKQRHTAHRVWERLGEEHGAEVSERAVRKWVAHRRRELGEPPAAMVPLVHDPGVEAEVDWGEAVVILRGVPTKVFVFHMRACHSGGAFVMAFGRETQQAFLEAHAAAFDWFGGVFQTIRYDNLKAAVTKILKGRRRIESDRFIALRSHGEALAAEMEYLRALPAEPFDAREQSTPRVDSKSLVTVRQNRYSVPVCLVGRKVLVKIGAREVEVFSEHRLIAVHERLQGRYGVSGKLDHYLELLRRKPGALRSSLPLAQERGRGQWPSCFDELWSSIEARYGASEAARQMVDVLLLARELTPARVELAVRGALAAGASDGRAVALLARRSERPEPVVIELEERLAGIGGHEPTLSDYDRLLQGAVSR